MTDEQFEALMIVLEEHGDLLADIAQTLENLIIEANHSDTSNDATLTTK